MTTGKERFHAAVTVTPIVDIVLVLLVVFLVLLPLMPPVLPSLGPHKCGGRDIRNTTRPLVTFRA